MTKPPDFTIRKEASQDLLEIWHFTEKSWSCQQADAYLRLIDRSFVLLAQGEKRTRPADDIAPGLKKYAVKSHMVYFLDGKSGPDIIRILHQNMDAPRRFAKHTKD